VLECFERVLEALQPDTPTRRYEELVCDVFEAQGHNTIRQDNAKQEGYVHTLGHGVGLKLHEQPSFGLAQGNQSVLRPGAVFTLEPGLYYPEKGLGVRLEDTVYLDENGQFHSLTNFDKRLIIEM
jgi:Xaa-Pro aminopeptidase